MTITLGVLALPDGLVWEDEFAWTPVKQGLDYGLTGALILQEATRQSGRPITLAGQKDGNSYTAWIARAQSYRGAASLTALATALQVAGAEFTLTMHDGRTFTVAPNQDGDGPLQVEPLAVFKSIPLANPDAASLYFIRAIRLIEIPP